LLCTTSPFISIRAGWLDIRPPMPRFSFNLKQHPAGLLAKTASVGAEGGNRSLLRKDMREIWQVMRGTTIRKIVIYGAAGEPAWQRRAVRYGLCQGNA
jgi:hypothetical protein